MLELLDARIPFCLTTVVSAPSAGREAPVCTGQKLIVHADGSIEGSYGGGGLEHAVREAAGVQLRSEQIGLARFLPSGERLPPRRSLRQGEAEDAAVEVALEPMVPAPHLIVVGAGHIAVPLARFAKTLNFVVTIIDDRARFANRERFPDADEIVVADFEQAIAQQTITAQSYLVLITRGHEHDEATLRRVVGSPAPYIGMIGSRRRVLVVFQRLAEQGVPEDFLNRVYAPIGLDIGARWPDEIALAIMAEIVNVRRGGRAASLTLRRRRESK